jgi:hypothetical protein
MLKKLIGNKHPGMAFNKHFDVEGTTLFHHACKSAAPRPKRSVEP